MQAYVRYYAPQPMLSSLVNGYVICYLHLPQDAPAHIIPLPAFPQQYLFFYPLDQLYFSDAKGSAIPSYKELVVGPYTERINISLSGRQLTIRVDLKPGVLHRLLHLPLHEIRNLPFDGADGFGADIRNVNQQLAESKTHQQMLRAIESFLLKKAARAKEVLPIDKAFHHVLAFPQQYTIDQLADQACLSLRQVERQFLTRVGVSPKLFFRQARFAQAYQLKRIYPRMSWAAIAYQCGYFDQMHLVRDFKQFAAEAPASYFRSVAFYRQNTSALNTLSPQADAYDPPS